MEEIVTLRGQLDILTQKPTPPRLHKFFKMLVSRIEDQDDQILKLTKELNLYYDTAQHIKDHERLAVQS